MAGQSPFHSVPDLTRLISDNPPLTLQHKHLEFLRTKEGAHNCSGLQLVRHTTEERLNEIMQIYRDHGVQINNPHVYIVEDGK